MIFDLNNDHYALLDVLWHRLFIRVKPCKVCHIPGWGVRKDGYKMYWHVLTYIPQKNLEFMNYVLACIGTYWHVLISIHDSWILGFLRVYMSIHAITCQYIPIHNSWILGFLGVYMSVHAITWIRRSYMGKGHYKLYSYWRSYVSWVEGFVDFNHPVR
jgi:hypothetical protein